jgi:F-type H+-transporting ATPase subunit a
MNALEFLVVYLRDNVIEPNVGKKWVNTYAPLLSDLLRLHPHGESDRHHPGLRRCCRCSITPCCHAPEQVPSSRACCHGGVTATGNYNVTREAWPRDVPRRSSSPAQRAHGFVQHWKNLVPHGYRVWLYPAAAFLSRLIGMLVRPFALTMRLAANMTGGHIAILAILSFVFIFFELFGQTAAIGVGLVLSLPVGVGLSGSS